MRPLADGARLCARCDRPVYDLTRATREEYSRFRAARPDACVHVIARGDEAEIVLLPSRKRQLPVASAAIAAALSIACSPGAAPDGAASAKSAPAKAASEVELAAEIEPAAPARGEPCEEPPPSEVEAEPAEEVTAAAPVPSRREQLEYPANGQYW